MQSTSESTLEAIDRNINQAKLEGNIRCLRNNSHIQLHLDLVAGLPGDHFDSFLESIDRLIALDPHHLQIEPVKLLQGSPLRDQAIERQLRYDPNPPYTILASKELSFSEIQRLQEISRLIDLTYNSGNFRNFLAELSRETNSFAKGLEWLAGEWRRRGLFRFPMNRQALFQSIINIVQERENDSSHRKLLENLAYDYARCERIVINRIPDFFDTELDSAEQEWVQRTVQSKTEEIKGQGIKLQYFAAVFTTLNSSAQRAVYLFCYLTATGQKMWIEEDYFTGEDQ